MKKFYDNKRLGKNIFLVTMLLLLATAPLQAQPGGGGAHGGKKPGGPGKPGGGPMAMMKMETIAITGKVGSTLPVVTRKYTGIFDPIEKVNSIARVSGKIMKIAFHEGEMVKKGDLLFEIEEDEWKAHVESAQASVESAQAAIHQYEARLREIDAFIRYRENTYQRNRDLYTQNAGSKDEMENSLSSLEAIRAQRAAAEASLKEAYASLKLAQANLALKKLDLDRTKIHAEISGKAGRLTYTLGNYVTPQSSPLITITQIDPIYVKFALSEKDFTSIYENMKKIEGTDTVRVMLANGHLYGKPGKFCFFDNEISTGTDTIMIWAKFDNPDGQLTPGGIAKVLLDLKGNEEMPSIPVSAVLHDSKGEFVYVLDKEGKATVRRIVLGPQMDNIQCITSGLRAGEIVVIDGTHKVMPGMKVINEATLPKTPQSGSTGK